MATGLEVRREFLETNPDPQSVAGELYHQAQLSPGFSNSRNVASIYTELSIPVLKDLEAQLAARHDRYSDYGSSTTPKVGVKWNATPSFMVRSTYAAGFRAPTLVENSTDVKNAFINGFLDPERCNERFKGGCRANSAYQSGANPDLQPEKGNSWTLGMVWEPASWLNASVDFWRIRRVDEIGTYDLDKVLADPARYANDPAAVITRAPLTDADRAAGATGGEITQIKSLLTNVALSDVRGVDLDLRGKFNLGEYGRLEPRLQVMFTTSYQSAPAPDDDLIEYAGTRGTPKTQATLGVTWKKPPGKCLPMSCTLEPCPVKTTTPSPALWRPKVMPSFAMASRHSTRSIWALPTKVSRTGTCAQRFKMRSTACLRSCPTAERVSTRPCIPPWGVMFS
jgi:iron complex outermembrane receptor protein